MNRLWVRLSLYFSLFILCGIIIVTLLPRLLLNRNVNEVITQTRDGVLSELDTFYREHGDWTGVSSLLHSYDIIIPRGLGTEPVALVFADADGTIIYDGTNQREKKELSISDRAKAFPIQVDGEIRGYLVIQKMVFIFPFRNDPNLLLVSFLNGLILFALLIGGLGMLAGIIVSRQLTAPLRELAETVRTFRQPFSSKRAPVKGTIEVREVATAFNQMAEALAETERLRRNLVGDVAHELRTPLTVLQANIQAILDDLYPLNKTEMHNLQVQTDLLRRLVNDLHELAQAEAHQLPLHIMQTNMNDFVQSLVEHFNAVTQAEGVTLMAKTPTVPVITPVDPDRMAQVLQNLIQNAVNHTAQGGQITVTLFANAQNIRLEVWDNGRGISLDDQKRIFERFYRTDETRSRATGGAGLGLPISKAIVEMHRGTIHVSSDGLAGHGTTFTVTLPASLAAEQV